MQHSQKKQYFLGMWTQKYVEFQDWRETLNGSDVRGGQIELLEAYKRLVCIFK